MRIRGSRLGNVLLFGNSSFLGGAKRALFLLALAVLLAVGVPGWARELAYPGVQRIVFKADVDTRRAVDALEHAGLGPALSRETASVHVSVIDDVRTVPLARARAWLDPRDPRRDAFIEGLPRLFEAEVRDSEGTTAETYSASQGGDNAYVLALPEPSGSLTGDAEADREAVLSPEELFGRARADFEAGITSHSSQSEHPRLPDFGSLIAHRAYQEGLPWGGTFSVPEIGDRVFRPRAERSGSGGGEHQSETSHEPVVEYSSEWLEDQLTGDENRLARLLAGTAGRAPVVFRTTRICSE